MRIFFVAPEVDPIVKVGGLGDVVGALPKYLKRMGHDVRVICPAYGSIKDRKDWKGHEAPLEVWVGHEKRLCKVWESRLPDSEVPIYFIEYNLFFGRPEVYDSPWGACSDNDHRFVFFTRAAINLCNYLQWIPEVFHCHDWTTGLLPVYLNTHDRGTAVASAATVMTIHNLQHQGTYYSGLVDWAHLSRKDVFRSDNIESVGGVNMLKGGLYNATKITTVSPTYAQEIRTPAGGCGLDSVLRYKGADLVGILNGIDTQVWNPATDKQLPANFTPDDLTGKAVCKRELQRAFGLKEDASVPIFGVVARLTHQKGLDLLGHIIPRLMAEMKVQVVLLGTGEQNLQGTFSHYAQQYAGRIGCFIGFDNTRAKLVYGGSDAFLIPSRFEPCGLTQMYSMRYGALPLARATGGLVDTITQYNEADSSGDGFLFAEASANALYYTIGWACSTWYDRPEHWQKLQQNAMATAARYDWQSSAQKYEELYAWAIKARSSGKLNA
jgi:starch synthase